MKEKPVFSSPIVSEHEIEIDKERDYYIVQHNELVQNLYFDFNGHKDMALTAPEEKILAYLISKIRPEATTLEPIVFDVKTYCEVSGIAVGNTNNPYPFIKAEIKKLADRSAWLAEENGKERLVRYIADAAIDKGSGKIEIKLHDRLAPYLLSLSGHYFQFSYRNILAMRSRYGIQLYKLLKSYSHNFPRIMFSVEDIKHYLDATKYDRFSNLKQKVIEPALNEINTYSDLEATAEYKKTGRGITHIVFILKDLEKPKSVDDENKRQARVNNANAKIDPNQVFWTEVLEGSEYP